MAKTIKGSEFESEVIKNEGIVLVDFYADWCMPCKMMAPVLDELSADAPNLKIVKVDIDDETALSVISKYQIRVVPTLMFFKNGQAVDAIASVVPKEALIEKINSLL